MKSHDSPWKFSLKRCNNNDNNNNTIIIIIIVIFMMITTKDSVMMVIMTSFPSTLLHRRTAYTRMIAKLWCNIWLTYMNEKDSAEEIESEL